MDVVFFCTILYIFCNLLPTKIHCLQNAPLGEPQPHPLDDLTAEVTESLYCRLWCVAELWKALLFLRGTLWKSNIAGWKMGARDWRCMDPIKNGDIPASYVSFTFTTPHGSLTARPWTMMVGRWVSFWVSVYFQGLLLLNFRWVDTKTCHFWRELPEFQGPSFWGPPSR